MRRIRFPTPATHPREPRHISIVGNRFTNCKRVWEWGMGADKCLDLIERRDNVILGTGNDAVLWK